MFGLSTYGDHRTIRKLKNKPELPQLDTPEQMMNYLEACSVNNYDLNQLLAQFRTFIAKPKQLQLTTSQETEGTIDLQMFKDLRRDNKKPVWHHDPNAKLPCDEHWNLFLTDLTRETEAAAKVEVIKHWVFGMNNRFTYKEIEAILDQFSTPEDRMTVRKLIAEDRAQRQKAVQSE